MTKTLYIWKGEIHIVSRKKRQINLLIKSWQFLKDNNPPKLNINWKNRPIFSILVSEISPNYHEYFLKENVFVIGEGYFKKDFAFKELHASTILHEMKHLEQYQNKKQFTGPKAEKEAYLLQRNFLEQIKYYSAVKWLDKQYKKKWWDILDKQTKKREGTKLFLNEFLENKFTLKEY